ncbi:EAL domain-containing protein [Sphingomonas sp. PAMC 26617]|uniref:EAL domain-containing protein n=1 Tax=Sphingomonas sp. PAMC 26617 TaxID=1112216 RepID=UPI001E5A1478|nr:EAL domain-containing protein [Sphingomonas sp. PAMC 26617]
MPPAGPEGDSPLVGQPWQMLCLVEITNFVQLRRYLGSLRADGLVHDLDGRIATEIGVSGAVRAGRATLEFMCRARSFDALRTVLDRVAEACRASFDIDGEAHQFVVAIGAAATACPNTDAVRIAEEAEAALSDSLPTSGITLRDVSVGTLGLDRLALIRDLPQAIASGEMFLQYQPKIHIRRQEINSAEALVRWQHPERGLILPGDFITIAEDSGHILALTLWTLEQVIADQVALASDGQDLTLFLNISGQLLGDASFVTMACQRVRESGAKIGFEITETAVIRHPDVAISNLQALADVGISIAIDDYGAGLSSLAYLKKLPAQELKIDKMFILDLTSSNRDPLIVRSTIDLAHALEMEVTAEGVETPAALALLSVMGCDIVQGYLISRPLSLGAFRQFMGNDPMSVLTAPRQPMFNTSASFWKSA